MIVTIYYFGFAKKGNGKTAKRLNGKEARRLNGKKAKRLQPVR
jgi:hypothetical protein